MSDFETCKAAKTGTIFLDRFDEGVRFLIMRGPCSLCAYLGIPEAHPLAGKSYDDLPVQCHGGLTFAGKSSGSFPEGFFWYGWDYAHCGDQAMYDSGRTGETAWDVAMVEDDSWSAIYEFKKLVKLAESIAVTK
jgi:hypothetical protein